MDDRDGRAEMLRHGPPGLWRALLAASGSVEQATVSTGATVGRVVRDEIPASPAAVWRAAFEHLADSRRELRVELVVEGPARDAIDELSERLAALPEPHVRALLAHHLGGLAADDVVWICRMAGEPAGERAVSEDDAIANGAAIVERAERALRKLDGRPVDAQLTPVAQLDPPDLAPPPEPTTADSWVRRLAPLALAGVVACGAALALGSTGSTDDPADDVESRPSTDADAVVLPEPEPCRGDGVLGAVDPSPSALRAAGEASFRDVFESTDAVVAGRVRSLRAADGWVTFEVGDGRVLDGTVDRVVSAFSMRGRVTSDLVTGDGLDVVAFVASDPTAPGGWRAPARGGIWIACWGGPALPVGDDDPRTWFEGGTLAAVGAAAVDRRDESQTMVLTRVDDRSVAGGVRLRDGTGLSIRMPGSVGAVMLDVETVGRGSVSLRGPDVRATVAFDRCPSDARSELAVSLGASPDVCGEWARVELVTDDYLSVAELAELEVHVIDRTEPRAGTVVQPRQGGGVVAIDAATLAPRWRVDGAPARTVGLTHGVAVVATGGDLVGFDLGDGSRTWSQELGESASVTPTDAAWLLVDHAGPWLRAFDPATGVSAWRVDGPPAAEWGPATPASELGDVIVVPEWFDDPDRPDRLVAVDAGVGRRRWSFDLGAGREGLPRFATDPERAIVVALDADNRLVRIDADDGSERWRTDPIRVTSIEGIWPNSVTLRSPVKRITISLTEGFHLPP